MRLPRLVITVCAWCSIAALYAAAGSTAQILPLESDVKAAFLYNFAKFVEWPAGAFPAPDGPFTFCLTGEGLNGALEKLVQGEKFVQRPLTVRRLPPGELNVRGCHVLFAGHAARSSAEIAAAVGTLPVLTVGEAEDFIDRGGMIRFTGAGNRIQFEINPAAAERSQLRISSRLLRLATIRSPRPGGTP